MQVFERRICYSGTQMIENQTQVILFYEIIHLPKPNVQFASFIMVVDLQKHYFQDNILWLSHIYSPSNNSLLCFVHSAITSVNETGLVMGENTHTQESSDNSCSMDHAGDHYLPFLCTGHHSPGKKTELTKFKFKSNCFTDMW